MTRIFILFLLILFSGCSKEESLNCTLVVEPYAIKENKGIDSMIQSVSGYYFYGDTTEYNVPSVEYAQRGEVVSRKDGSVFSADGVGVRDQSGILRFSGLNKYRVIVVLYDEQSGAYAWRRSILQNGVPELLTRIRFRLWRLGETYKESGWTVFIPEAN